jgi:hypothetical protein
MKHYFIWGLLFTLLFVIPVTAQKQTTLLTTRESDDLISKARRSSLTTNEYRNIGYYLLRENSPKSANRYFGMASKESSRIRNKYNFRSDSKIKKETERLKREAGSLMNLVYVSNTNTAIEKEIELYKSIAQKSYNKTIKLIEEAKPIDRILFGHLAREGKKYTILKEFVLKHLDLLKRKTEFETKAQYKVHKDTYKKLEQEVTKEIDDKIKNIEIPYKQALKNCANHKGSIERREKTNSFIKKYPPILKNYIEARTNIKSMKYNAKKQEFTIIAKFKDEKNVINPYKTKTYTIAVPQNEAQQFKESKQSNQYLFFLQDLKAIISNAKTYTIEPIHTWYTKLNCDKDKEAPVLLVNGKPSTQDIESYLKSILRKDKNFIVANQNTSPEYGKGYTDEYKKIRISASFDSSGKITKCSVDYPFKSSYGLVYNSYTDKKSLQKLAQEIIFIIQESKVKIIPQMRSCQPMKTNINFFHYPSK